MTVPRTELNSPLIACSLDGKGQRARLEEWPNSPARQRPASVPLSASGGEDEAERF